MFENYLQDALVYKKLEEHLVVFFNSKIAELRINGNFYELGFYNTKFSNGESFMDGNPIFSVKNKQNENVLKVIIDSVLELIEYDSKTDAGTVHVVIADIRMLDGIKIKIFEWLDKSI